MAAGKFAGAVAVAGGTVAVAGIVVVLVAAAVVVAAAAAASAVAQHVVFQVVHFSQLAGDAPPNVPMDHAFSHLVQVPQLQSHLRAAHD